MKTETCPRCFGKGFLQRYPIRTKLDYWNTCSACDGSGLRYEEGNTKLLLALALSVLFLLTAILLHGCKVEPPPRTLEPVGPPLPEIPLREWDYQKAYCNKPGWRVEVTLDDRSRADCLSPDHAIELDWAHKWKECFDQAAHYAAQTGLKPMCVLLVRPDEDVPAELIDLVQTEADKRGIALRVVVPLRAE